MDQHVSQVSHLSGLPNQIFGGFPKGSLCIIEEDENGFYGKLLFEGITSLAFLDLGPVVVVDNDGRNGLERLQALPTQTRAKDKRQPNDQHASEMKIAWRYQNTVLSKTSFSFDFGTFISVKEIEQLDKNNFKAITARELQELISSDFSGSIFVAASCNINLKTAIALKSWTRRTGGRCLILGDILPETSAMKSRFKSISDGYISFEAFGFGQKSYPEFEGVINIQKIPKVNQLNVSGQIDTLDMGFQWKSNRYFVVDKLSLPPDVSETASRTVGCASTNKQLDF